MLGLLNKFVSLDRIVSLEEIPTWGPVKRMVLRSVMSSPSNRLQLRELAKSFGRARYPAKFHDQFDSFLDFADPVLDDLLELTKYREPCDRFMGSFLDWRTKYKTAHDNTADSEAFVTLTEEQYRGVTPSPELMKHYASIHSILLNAAVRAGKHKKQHERLFSHIDGLEKLHLLGKQVFEAMPSCMGRVGDMDDLMVYELHQLDPPLNCMPSFHIANSFYLKTILDSWHLPDDCSLVYSQADQLAKYMIPCVMKVMQHSASDIAGGLMLAKLICESRGIAFKDPFRYLEQFGVMEEYPDIPWNLIRRNYDNLGIQIRLADGDLVKGIQRLYKDNGCLLTPSGEYNKYLVCEGGKTRLVEFDTDDAA